MKLLAWVLWGLSCSGFGEQETAKGGETADSGSGRWTGTAQVRVVDESGAPVEGAWVMPGGAPEEGWVQTDEDGQAQVEVTDDGVTDRYLLAGLEGWFSGGVEVGDGADTYEIEIRPLPSEDNASYAFQSGGDGSSPASDECGHCHQTIGDDWSGSPHGGAASNLRTWDLYTGSAAEVVDPAACDVLGGWTAEGQAPGEDGVTQERCYLGLGVLPLLHEDCGGPGEPACDHPDQRASLESFGSCGDCHSPAMDGATPGQLDLAASFGVAHEGVTCDFCHKVQESMADASPGLDGGLTLLRPSEETTIPGQLFDPITFGPYADVIVPIMKGTWAPQFRESGWCASCHEYARGALGEDEALQVDGDRWPDGLPIHETFSEHVAWGGESPALTCQACHMTTLGEESSTYDITALGLTPSVANGWTRDSGEVRHHDFGIAELSAPTLAVELEEVGDVLEASVTVSNYSAGHAVPTGDPLKQLLVVVTAVDGDGRPVAATGGQAVPDLGGYRVMGTVGEDLLVDGTEVTLVGEGASDLERLVMAVEAGMVDTETLDFRFVRPTGDWDDYEGPGAGSFSSDDLSPEEKGLALYEILGAVTVSALSDSTLELSETPPDLQTGDRGFLGGSDDWAGAPGWLYAKVMVDSEGGRGVAHYRAVDITSDNRIAAGGDATSVHGFPLPETGDLVVTAQLVRRRYGATVADLYGWERGDEVIATAEVSWK
ncbi:MAG: hypothetical protein QGG40_03500 [Myxococcota bacterium]|nr:hypothetical protein [Myxococcota bacterium]